MNVSVRNEKALRISMFKEKNIQKNQPQSATERRSVSHFGSQSGQAVLEYLLVLVVVVGIALGVLYQLNTALKKYVQSYFGDYVACLLETGELPSLGGSSGANTDSCNAAYEEFSLKNGRPLIAGDGSSSSNKGSNRSGNRGGGRSGGSRVTRNNSSQNAERAAGSSVVAGSVKKNSRKELQGGSESDSSQSGYRAQKQRGNGQVRISLKSKTKNEKTIAKSIDLKGKLRGRSQKKIPIDMEKFKRQPAQADLTIGLSFGDYIRYIIIFGILILIIVFFGGQLLQLKKSWDNN